jgi:hypothetical protein
MNVPSVALQYFTPVLGSCPKMTVIVNLKIGVLRALGTPLKIKKHLSMSFTFFVNI